MGKLAVLYLHRARREWQPGCWQGAETQILHLLQLLTACLHRRNLKAKGRGEQHVRLQEPRRLKECPKGLPPCAGSCPDPPPDSRATLPLRLSRSDRSTTLWPLSRDRPPLALTSPQRASSTQLSAEFNSFFLG